MSFAALISIVILVGLVAIAFIPPVLVLRGQRFWAPWVMVGAIALLVLSVGSLAGTEVYYAAKLNAALSSKGSGSFYTSSDYQELSRLRELWSMVFVSAIVTSFLSYAIGFLGVAYRWRAVAARAVELEALTARLAEKREFQSPAR